MIASETLHPRPLLLAVAIGLLAGAALHSALVMPWLGLLVHEPGEVDWLSASSSLERFVAVLKPSLLLTAIYGPFLLALAAFADRERLRSPLAWVFLGMVGVVPLAFLAWMGANDPFDCYANCHPSGLRDLVAIGAVLAPGGMGALAAWLVRYTGRKEAA